jgi:PAS domain S-box-containing protein
MEPPLVEGAGVREGSFRDGAVRVGGVETAAFDEMRARVSREAELVRESEAKLRLSMEASELGAFYWYPQEDRVEADQRMLAFFGLTSNPELSLQKALDTMIHPADQPRYAGAIARSLDPRGDGKLREDIRVRWQDGSEHHLSVRARVEFGGDPRRAVRMAGVIADIGGRKRAEAALRESEERYRKLAQELNAEVRERTRELEERNAELVVETERVQELSRRMMQVQDEERRRLAQELHDSAGQTLTVLGMSLAEVERCAAEADAVAAHDASGVKARGVVARGKKLKGKTRGAASGLRGGVGVSEERIRARLKQRIAETKDIVERLTQEIRTASYLLHPPLLDDAGLGPTLRWYVEGLTERSNLQIELTVPRNFGRLPREMELAVFRVVQECLTNVMRHSESRVAEIRVAREGGDVCVRVLDRGKGIGAERLASIQAGGAGVGIGGMRDRVGQLGGELKVESDGKGTRVEVRIPEEKEDAETLKAKAQGA